MAIQYHGRNVSGPTELASSIRADAEAFVDHDPVWNWTADFAIQTPEAQAWLDEALRQLFSSALANPDEDVAIRQIDTYSLCAEQVSPRQAAAFAISAGPDVATGKDALVWRPMAALAHSILSELAPFQQEIVGAFDKATPRARRRLSAALKDTPIIFGDLNAKERVRRDLIDHLDMG